MGCFFPRNYKLQFVAGSKVMTYIAFCIPYSTPPLFSKRRGRKKGLRWQICKKRDANSWAKAAINSNKSDKVEGVRAECDMDCIKGYDWDALIKLGI